MAKDVSLIARDVLSVSTLSIIIAAALAYISSLAQDGLQPGENFAIIRSLRDSNVSIF